MNDLYVILIIHGDGDEFFPPNKDGDRDEEAGMRMRIFPQAGKREWERGKISSFLPPFPLEDQISPLSFPNPHFPQCRAGVWRGGGFLTSLPSLV